MTESESFDIVLGAAPPGLEALGSSEWRKAQSSLAINLGSRSMQTARKTFPQDLKWEELVRRYERSQTSGMTTAGLDEDINTAALEALVPCELEQRAGSQ